MEGVSREIRSIDSDALEALSVKAWAYNPLRLEIAAHAGLASVGAIPVRAKKTLAGGKIDIPSWVLIGPFPVKFRD